MMHYRKGVNIEQEIKKKDLPFDDCMPKGRDFLWMRVKGGTDVNNVVPFAKNALDKGEYRTIVWTGIGGGLVKAVSSAEIMKRTHTLYQVTRMCHVITEEHWVPQMEGLDALFAKRRVPCLHILLTLDKIDDNVNGVQKPNVASALVRRGGGTVLPPSSRNRNPRGNRGQQQHHPNQGQRENGDPGPQTQRQQQKPTTSTASQSHSEEQTTKSGESSGAKRKRNRKPKPKPKESHNADSNTPQKSSGQQKTNTNTPKKTAPQRRET